MDGTAYLISEAYTKDSIGQRIPTEAMTEIFVHEGSINRNEFDVAGQHGLSADLVLITQAINYSGEKIVQYDGKRYGVYRTFRNPDSDEIEIYMERKGGNE